MKKKIKPVSAKPAAKKPVEKRNLLQIIDSFFDKRLFPLFIVIICINILIAGLLYLPAPSITGDDTGYVLRAYAFAHHFTFPGGGSQGPLYPVAMSWITLISGISLLPLKLFSMACMAGSIALIFFTFRNKIPSSVLITVLILHSINCNILYYASQTFSEAFYMLLQTWMLFIFCKHFIMQNQKIPFSIKSSYKKNLLLAVSILAMCLTRSIGFAIIPAVVFYLLLFKQWRNALLFCASFFAVYLLYNLLIRMIWVENISQFTVQVSGALSRDGYHMEYGRETFSGFTHRLVVNSNIYLSRYFYEISGFGEGSNHLLDTSGFRTVLTYAGALVALLITFKKNKYIFFTGLIAGSLCLASFIAGPESWAHERILIPVMPLLGILFAGGLYYIFKIKRLIFLQFILPVITLVIGICMFNKTCDAITNARSMVDEFSGFNPDWEHYLRASQWAADSLPSNSIVACRKASLSTIYGNGKPFFGITQIPSENIQALLDDWKMFQNKYAAFNVDTVRKGIPVYALKILRKNLTGRIVLDNKGVGDSYVIMSLNKVEKDSLDWVCSKTNSTYISSPDSIKTLIKLCDNKAALYNADSLLSLLIKSGVTHVLQAQIRQQADVKDPAHTVNTVELYMGYINDKYRDFLTVVKTLGAPDDEPATISIINWEKITNFKPK